MKEPIPIATKPPALLTQLAKSALLGPHLSLWPYRHFLSHLLGVLTFLSLLGRAFLSGPVHGRPTGPEQQRASTNEGRSTVSWIRVKSSGLEHRLHHPIHHPPPAIPRQSDGVKATCVLPPKAKLVRTDAPKGHGRSDSIRNPDIVSSPHTPRVTKIYRP